MATAADRADKLSDAEFEKAIAAMQEGRAPFKSSKKFRSLAETIIDKLWETHEQPGESA